MEQKEKKKKKNRIEGWNIIEPNRKTNILFGGHTGHANQKFEVGMRMKKEMLKK